MSEIQYRIYANGTVVHEDDFFRYDLSAPHEDFDDYQTVSVPVAVVDHIQESFCSGCLLYRRD
ncbi:MAG: hypothetical protein D3906_01460 [Candidatus Electrothrix sp. AUS1_2]|nr:hypothetical protein [Candidatus Electrothrix sp. AUS1_2]